MKSLVLLVLPGFFLAGVQTLPPGSHHISGRFGAHLTSRLNLQKENDFETPSSVDHQYRGARGYQLLRLNDPLDCLSQVICGLNTYPPQKPSVRTNVANDFAFLLKNSIAKLRSEKPPPTSSTTTTVAPATKRTTTAAPLNDDDDDDDDSDENEVDHEGDEVNEYDYEELAPPFGRRHIRMKRDSIFSKRKSSSKNGKASGKGKKNKKFAMSKLPRPTTKPLTPLDKLRMETDLRAKLLSDAQCVNGLIDHSCPFNYQQMMVLMSSSLERERTVSFTANRVLPMVGYLIKSRNYTGTLQATFLSIERINNYTIEADKENKPIDFTHILDEVMNRETGESGLRIVDTSNDSASTSVWEDDEFDFNLAHPYERRRPESDNYKLDKRKKAAEKLKKQKGAGKGKEQDDQSEETSSEEESDEIRFHEGPRPNNGESSSEEDDENSAQQENSKTRTKTRVSGVGVKSNTPGPVFGFTHLRKHAEDE